MAKQNARPRKRKSMRGQGSLSLFPMITKDHRTYINRRADVPKPWWKGSSDEGHTTCIMYTHDPSHDFETMRNVHAIGLKIADLRTGAEKSSDEVDPEYYQTVFWINMKAFSQFWHESNPPTATADDTTGSSQEVEVVEPCSADGLGKKRECGVRQWDQPIYNHFPANADGNRTRYTSLTATTKDKDTGETKPTQGTIFECGDCGWTRMILDGKTALCPRVCCVRM